MTEKSEALRDFEEAIQDNNYVRAERIARELGKPAGEIKELQEKAIKQFILEFRNPQGTVALMEDYLLTKEEIDHLLRSLLQEAEEKKITDKRQYDIKTMRYLTLREWVKEYF